MQFWIGKHASAPRQMLFATADNHGVPHAVVHASHYGLFTRSSHSDDAHFTCDRCGLALRLRITDGYSPTETEVREALSGATPKEVVAGAKRQPHEEKVDRRAYDTYRARERSDKAAETRRALVEIEALEMEEEYGQAVASEGAMAHV